MKSVGTTLQFTTALAYFKVLQTNGARGLFGGKSFWRHLLEAMDRFGRDTIPRWRWRHRRFSLTNKRIEHTCPESNVAKPAHQQNIEHFHPSRPVRHGELENHSELVCLMLKTAKELQSS